MNKFTGMLLGLAPILFGGLLSLLIYNSWPTLIGLIVIGILTLLSLLLARSIFLTVSDMGGNEFISRVGASPDLDNLIPTEGSNVKLLAAEEIKAHFLNEDIFSECSIRLWGDWQGRPYVPNQEVKSIDYDTEGDALIIKFSSGNKLKVIQAEKILVAPSYLKILKASAIVWDFQIKFHKKADPEKVSKHYTYSNKKILTHSEARKKLNFNVSLGEVAVGLYGKIV